MLMMMETFVGGGLCSKVIVSDLEGEVAVGVLGGEVVCSGLESEFVCW